MQQCSVLSQAIARRRYDRVKLKNQTNTGCPVILIKRHVLDGFTTTTNCLLPVLSTVLTTCKKQYACSALNAILVHTYDEPYFRIFSSTRLLAWVWAFQPIADVARMPGGRWCRPCASRKEFTYYCNIRGIRVKQNSLLHRRTSIIAYHVSKILPSKSEVVASNK